MIFTWSYPTEQVNLRLRENWISTDAFGLNREWSVHDPFFINIPSAFENQTYGYVHNNFRLKRKEKVAIFCHLCHGTYCIDVYSEYGLLSGTSRIRRKK